MRIFSKEDEQRLEEYQKHVEATYEKYMLAALQIYKELDRAPVSVLQQRLNIGYAMAAKLNEVIMEQNPTKNEN